MQLNKIYLGSWALASNLHLKEFYRVLKSGHSSYFSDKEVKAWLKNFNFVKLEYSPEAFNSVNGELKNGLRFDVLEDGIMFISKDAEDIVKDRDHLYQFMEGNFRPLWNNLLSRDTALIELSAFAKETKNLENSVNKMAEKYPVVLVVSDAKEDDLEKIFDIFEVIPYKKVGLEKGSVWIGEDLVILNDFNFEKYDLVEAVRYLMFARLYEIQLTNLLEKQRTLWNKIEGIRSRRYYKNTELPEVRDAVLLVQNQANFYRSYSKQINQLLNWREKFIGEYLSDHVLANLFKDFFLSLHSSQKYLSELWEMTAGYANDTVESISLLYSDSQQRELRTLQKLFLVSAVVSILSLGTLAGANRFNYDTDGVFQGFSNIYAWHRGSFLWFGGITILASFVIYYFFYLVFTRFKTPEKILDKNKKKDKK